MPDAYNTITVLDVLTLWRSRTDCPPGDRDRMQVKVAHASTESRLINGRIEFLVPCLHSTVSAPYATRVIQSGTKFHLVFSIQE